jgi:predicted PurR-regulated permease PerM
MPFLSSSRFSTGLLAVVLTVAALYFAEPVLMPLVTAILLTFLLRPAVVALERHRFPRGIAVALVCLGILAGFGSVGWVLTRQLHELALLLDEYRGHMRAKIENLRAIVNEVDEAARGKKSLDADPPQQSANEGPSAGQPATDAAPAATGPARLVETDKLTTKPEVVTVAREEPPSALTAVRVAWAALSTPLATTVVVGVLVLFILSNFEDLRNRLLRLAGQGKLTVTTRTLDEISRRISRYLLANAMVNGGFGVVVFLGLRLIGVDYAALWGVLAAALRFVPYVGSACAAFLTIGMAVIQFPDWRTPSLVAGLFLLLELITANLVEPLTYGKSAGVSTVALLVSATFWAWLWGPMGLVLSVPLTVVLAVVGKHIPQFEALAILLGDEPALEAHESFYQRLLAGDVDEAAALLDEQLAKNGRAAAYDGLLIPALALAEHDRHRGELDEADKDFVRQNARDLIEENAPVGIEPGSARVHVAGCPAHDLTDDLALTMLQHLAGPKCEVLVVESGLMASEKIDAVAHPAPDAVLISAFGPGGAAHARYLCKRIRQQCPHLRIVVGRWGYSGDRDRLAASLKARGADQVVTTLQEALDVIDRIQPMPLSA